MTGRVNFINGHPLDEQSGVNLEHDSQKVDVDDDEWREKEERAMAPRKRGLNPGA